MWETSTLPHYSLISGELDCSPLFYYLSLGYRRTRSYSCSAIVPKHVSVKNLVSVKSSV